MIVFQDADIVIEYDLAHEILCAKWHPIRFKKMFELEHSIHKLVTKVNELEVKKLMLYSIRNVKDIPFENFESFMLLLISSLAESGVRKVARIIFDDSEIEEVTETSDTINRGMGVLYQYGTFRNRQAAIDWLNRE